MNTSPEMAYRPWHQRRWLRLAVLVAVLVALQQSGTLVLSQVQDFLAALGDHWGVAVLAAVAAVYVVVMALPFVPAMEISLALMMMLGARGIATVYVATLLALSLSYAVGRLIPVPVIARMLAWLRLHRARELASQLAPLTPQERVTHLIRVAPPRLVPFLLRHRYLALALVFNLPGNSLLGGGGGIALMAGLSRLFAFPRYLLMLAVAISPLPLLLLAHDLWPMWWPWAP